jgi:hypothetical protein
MSSQQPTTSVTDTIKNYFTNATQYISQTGQSMSNWVKSKMSSTGGRRTRRKKNHGGMSSIHGIHTAKASYVGGKKRRHKRSRHHSRK